MGENSTGVDGHVVEPEEEEARIYCRQCATVHYQRQMRAIAASKSTVSEEILALKFEPFVFLM